MCSQPRRISLGIGTDTFVPGTHMCYIFNDEAERQSLIARYIESGLGAGEAVHYFPTSPPRGGADAFLSQLKIDAGPNLQPGQFSLLAAAEAYCPDGTFIPARMLERLRETYAASIAGGYTGARASGEMAWALENRPGSDRLIEYEALINTIVAEHPITALCQYDARLFDGGTLFDVLNVHPMMVVRGQVVYNPYYIAPKEFFERRATRQ